jgi:hypothetical protein
MICIHCGTSAGRWRRRGGRCPACKHAFAFDPSSDPYRLSDADFHAAVKAVSGDRHFFGARQLWVELNRRWTWTSPAWNFFLGAFPWVGAAGGVALGVLDVIELHLFGLFLCGLMGGWVAGGIVGMNFPRLSDPPPPPKIPYDVFHTHCLERWEAVHGPLARLIPEPLAAAPLREVPADVAVFSFDRVVVTQHAVTAAMLVANRFHFENSCAVLSLDGYPFGIADTVKKMVRRNPRLTVFALHDASEEGAALLSTLRNHAWFPGRDTLIVDVGLHTRESIGIPEPARKKLPAAYRGWFTFAHKAALAEVPPGEVIGILQRAFAATGAPGQPAYLEAASRAAAAGGIVWVGQLGPEPGDTTSTDGFG